jgi:16S rRNA (guanine(966)-N(2))-methyltransferase RsmD
MSHLRVIGGTAKGRRLRMVPGEGTRPIGDRVKQALFNIIGPEVEGSAFLDLFAGTGSVGIEALSRGAVRSVFIDQDAQACKTIQHNLVHTRLASGATVLRTEVFSALKRERLGGFDYVYVAPPQHRGLWDRTVLELDRQTGWVNPDGWVVAQMHPREFAELGLERLRLFDQRKYGQTLLAFYELPGG